MGKKKDAAVKAAQKVTGQSITRFFDKQTFTAPRSSGGRGSSGGIGRRGRRGARALPGEALEGSALSRAREAQQEEWAVEQSLFDNVMLSQDMDPVRVVWKQVEEVAGGKGSSRAPCQGVNAKRFIQSAAAQRAPTEPSRVRDLEEDLFEELVAGAGEASTSGGGCPPTQPTSNVPSARESGLGRRRAPFAGQPTTVEPPAAADNATAAGNISSAATGAGLAWGQTAKKSKRRAEEAALRPSPVTTMKRTGGRAASRTPGSGGPSTGKRRKAFLDLLDQVESLVSQRPNQPDPPAPHPLSPSTFVTPGRRKGSEPSPSLSAGLHPPTGVTPLQRGTLHLPSPCPPTHPTPNRRVGDPGMTPHTQRKQRQAAAAAASVAELCKELMGDSPAPRVGPAALFDGATTGSPENNGSSDGPPVLPLLGDREALLHTVLQVEERDGAKVARLLNEFTDAELELHLRDNWYDTPLEPGDTLNLLATVEECQDGRRYVRVDLNAGLVVLHPDVLLSGTRVTSGTKCPRQAVIEELFAGDGGSNDKAVLGTMLHELFQAALSSDGDLAAADLTAAVDQIVASSTLMLFEVGLDEATAKAALTEAVSQILKWRALFCRPLPSAAAAVDMGPKGPGAGGLGEQRVAISEVIDIEESIWSPRFGLKGMIDASVRLVLKETPPSQPPSTRPVGDEGGAISRPLVFSGRSAREATSVAADGRGERRHVAPLELKTGKAYHGHRAQVALYMLLMADRYETDVSTGLLWYIQQEQPQGVQYIHGEVASLLQIRNALAAHLARRRPDSLPALPPMLRDPQACKSCFQRASCTLIHKAMEGGDAESAGMGDLFDQATDHVRPQHAEFFRRWLSLVEDELQSEKSSGRTSDVWARSSADREAAGAPCVGSLELVGRVQKAGSEADSGVEYEFRRSAGAGASSSGLSAGDHVLLSIEGRHAAVGRGSVTSISPDGLSVRLYRPLPARFEAPVDTGPGAGVKSLAWRVDGNGIASTGAGLRRNLLSLLSTGEGRAPRLRQLVVDLEAPRFAPRIPIESEAYLAEHAAAMNDDQQAAVRKVLSAEDYAIILGMPGTGKTATVCHMVGAARAAGLSVLLTAYTNSAVDNMLLRLKANGQHDVLRLGHRRAVHPDLQEHCLGGDRFPASSVAELKHLMAEVGVVGCTCLGVGHTLLQGRLFDVVVIDEASQITLPASLGAFATASRFVLVGDHYQLPPIVTSSEAASRGLAVSLFELLTGAQPSACVTLAAQYRMCSPIMDLANRLVYSGRMMCGSPDVGTARLRVAGRDGGGGTGSQPSWTLAASDPSQPLVFLDTGASAREAAAGSSARNEGEARIVMACLDAMASSGVDMASVAVISPFRSQVALLTKAARNSPSGSAAEVLTIDKAQGRDKAVVVVSLVKSNEDESAGQLLTDWRRINVAITRAKHKLILIGSASTLSTVPFFRILLDSAAQERWLHTVTAPPLPMPHRQ